MLILRQARRRFRSRPDMDSYRLACLALFLSVPFGVLGAEVLQMKGVQFALAAPQAWLVGLVLGVSMFTYTILLTRLLKRQPPLFLKRLFPRHDLLCPRSTSEITGLRLDFVGGRDPQDTVDGVIHNRSGELQRILRCGLPQQFPLGRQSLLLEMLFADLSRFTKTRFQIIFPEAECGRRQEMYIVASCTMSSSQQPVPNEIPPLEQMQSTMERLFDRLITLGIAPRIMNAFEVRQMISAELGGCTNRFHLNRDWHAVGNLGWEPNFRDLVLRPQERYMQVADRQSFTIALEQLPDSSSFEWLATTLADLPAAHVSLFITPWSADDPLSRLSMAQKLKKHSLDDSAASSAAQMSFFFRFDGRDAFQLEREVATARKYFASLGINRAVLPSYRQPQLQNWRSTLPCAQEQSYTNHLIAFMRTSPVSS